MDPNDPRITTAFDPRVISSLEPEPEADSRRGVHGEHGEPDTDDHIGDPLPFGNDADDLGDAR